MQTKSAATFSAGSEEPEGIRAETGLHQTGGGGKYPVQSTAGQLIAAVLDNLKLLLLGPVIAALFAFGIASVLPKWYTSVVYLNLDETGARVADTLMRSTPVLDKVLTEFNVPRDTLEARRRFIENNRRIVVASGETQRTSNLFRMEYSDKNPLVAQKVNSLLLEAWLESTKPPPDKRAVIEAQIVRTDEQAKSVSRLIERLQKDAPSLVTQGMQGEIATPILGLITKRDEILANLITVRSSLNGTSRDVIFGAPDLPEEASWPNRWTITILAAVVTGLLLLMFVILRRFRSAQI